MIKMLVFMLKLVESLLFAGGILVLVYLYMQGGTPLLLATALPVYAVFGAVYLVLGLSLNSMAELVLVRRKRRAEQQQKVLQAQIDTGEYEDIDPGTPWRHTRFSNSIAH